MMAKMAPRKNVVKELLFFVQSKFGCSPFEALQGILVIFYSEESIVNAK